MMLFTKYKYEDLSNDARADVYSKMHLECKGNAYVIDLLDKSWEHWANNGWYFDGATFVNERNGYFWEVAAFIHDALNKMGYVGANADFIILKIMLTLGYEDDMVFERYRYFKWTWINVLKHKIKGTFKSSKKINI